MMMIDDDAVM